MKEYLQKNYKKIIPYVIAVCVVVSVLVTGITAIVDIQRVGLKSYRVQHQYMAQLPVENIYPQEAFTHEFICTSSDMVALQVEGVIAEETTGIVGYTIVDVDGNLVLEGYEDIQAQRNPSYDGV